MKGFFTMLLLPVLSFCQAQTDIKLPDPQTKGGKPIMEALMNRHSSREFSPEKLSLQTLSDLLWAANGYNRHAEKKRTAPSSMDYQEIDIYLAMETGLFLWDPEKNRLKQILGTDIREATGKQDFVKGAPLNLIYVANYNRVKGGRSDKQIRASFANTGLIAENAYLYCASAGLNAIIRAYFDEPELSKKMNLQGDQLIILCQTIGKPPAK